MVDREHPQEITHWVVTPDVYGGYSFAAPVKINGRWEERAELFRTIQGDEEISKAIVYVDTDVALSDYLALGDFTATSDPTTLDTTHQVRQFDKIPDLRINTYERKAIL